MAAEARRVDPDICAGLPGVRRPVSNHSGLSHCSSQSSSHPRHASSSSSLNEKHDADHARPEKEHAPRYPRISLPVQMMRDSYDVVVIGTGYGGGVAASRFARARQSVCVLERGTERWPGEFPESTVDAIKEVRVSGEFAPGDRRGVKGSLVRGGKPTSLYHLALGDGQNVYVGNGLGGTSLVNANVFLEATPAVLGMEIWPVELRGADKWREYYDRASHVLEPVEYPAAHPRLLKADFLEKQANLLNLQQNFHRVKQTTRFHDGPNSTGVPMKASTLTGMDATGLNDGSKSSTLVNYLSDAWNWGAEMFCECEVRYVTKAPAGREGYIVYFAWHSGKRAKFRAFRDDLMWVHAKKVVAFGAGSLGTTEILLRSKGMGMSMSDDVGTEMSGNGDMLGFAYDTDYEVNCIADPGKSDSSRPVGPCITSMLDLRDTKNPLEGFVVQDCAVPHAISHFLYPLLECSPTLGRPAPGGVDKLKRRLMKPLVSGGKLDRTAAYLVMSHDSSQGRLTLQHDNPVLGYSGVGRSESVSRIHSFLETMTEVAGGEFKANPAWTALGGQQITVHPIGGARVSSDGTGRKGVTNHAGEIFIGEGSETHAGLIVCDGAAMPAALGVNPFATITAFAERVVQQAASRLGLSIDLETSNGLLDLFGSPAYPIPRDTTMTNLHHTMLRATETRATSLGFSEVMTGFIHAGCEVLDFGVATSLARSQCESARVFLTVNSWDTTELLHNHTHSANITGTFSCNSLGGIFVIHRGTFQLLVPDPRQAETANLIYDFDIVSPGGRRLHFNGYKVVNAASFLSPRQLWRQTTTLLVTITDPDTSLVVGRGSLSVKGHDLLDEIKSFEPGGATLFSKIGTAAGFARYFAKQVSIPFFSTLGHLQWPAGEPEVPEKAMTPSATSMLEAVDGVRSALLMWDPITQTKEPPQTILFIPGAAVDHTIFALPTLPQNTISYFREAGYRTYCLVHRTGRTATAREGYTPYDTRLDILAAMTHIRSTEGSRKMYIVAHCIGSLAFACGLLDGTIPAEWILGATCSAVFMNPRFGRVNQLTSSVPVGVYQSILGPYYDCVSTKSDPLVQQVVNQALRFYPVGSRRETCRSVVCHRSELCFSRLWNHENLNEATHKNLHHFLGGVSMRSMGWIMHCGQIEKVTTNGPSRESLVTPENLERLKGIPILFVAGADNIVYTPDNTDASYTTLCNVHGRKWYQREVFPSTGHLDTWMGTHSHRVVYPRIRHHVEEVMRVQPTE